MKARLVLRAITMWTAFIAAFDLYLAVMPSTGIANQLHGAWPPNLADWVIGHHDRIVIVKAAVSAAMAIWWLAAAMKPESRPWLRLANAVFSGWLMVQVFVIWAAVAAVLLEISGLPHESTGSNFLTIFRITDLSWLILVTLCLPVIQAVLGEWACRLSRCQSRESRPIAAVEAA